MTSFEFSADISVDDPDIIHFNPSVHATLLNTMTSNIVFVPWRVFLDLPEVAGTNITVRDGQIIHDGKINLMVKQDGSVVPNVGILDEYSHTWIIKTARMNQLNDVITKLSTYSTVIKVNLVKKNVFSEKFEVPGVLVISPKSRCMQDIIDQLRYARRCIIEGRPFSIELDLRSAMRQWSRRVLVTRFSCDGGRFRVANGATPRSVFYHHNVLSCLPPLLCNLAGPSVYKVNNKYKGQDGRGESANEEPAIILCGSSSNDTDRQRNDVYLLAEWFSMFMDGFCLKCRMPYLAEDSRYCRCGLSASSHFHTPRNQRIPIERGSTNAKDDNFAKEHRIEDDGRLQHQQEQPSPSPPPIEELQLQHEQKNQFEKQEETDSTETIAKEYEYNVVFDDDFYDELIMETTFEMDDDFNDNMSKSTLGIFDASATEDEEDIDDLASVSGDLYLKAKGDNTYRLYVGDVLNRSPSKKDKRKMSLVRRLHNGEVEEAAGPYTKTCGPMVTQRILELKGHSGIVVNAVGSEKSTKQACLRNGKYPKNGSHDVPNEVFSLLLYALQNSGSGREHYLEKSISCSGRFPLSPVRASSRITENRAKYAKPLRRSSVRRVFSLRRDRRKVTTTKRAHEVKTTSYTTPV